MARKKIQHPYPALAIANFFLEKASEAGISLTPMKVQKLVYYAHGWYLALSGGKPLIQEKVYAWNYGPVIRELYDTFKHYGRSSITELAKNPFVGDVYRIDEEDTDVRKVLDRIWELYGSQTAVQLSNATHKEGSPWCKTYKVGEKDLIIASETMQSYFESLKSNGQK